ncbi:glutathione S-transferase T3-like protein [Tanacetum coccineum]
MRPVTAKKRMVQSDDAPRQTPWTMEEEIALCKESKTGQYEKRTYDMVIGKWKTVRLAVIRFCEVYNNIMRMGPESGAGDEDYVQMAMIHYQIDTGIPFKLRHCWEVLKDHPKWQEIAIPTFNTGSEGSSKRHKSTGSSSDKAKAAGKKRGSKSSASASSSVNEDALARLMVTEMGAQEKEERLAFLEIKRREVECREREIEQQDMRFYLQPYDHLTGDQRKAMDEIRAKIKAKYNLQYYWREKADVALRWMVSDASLLHPALLEKPFRILEDHPKWQEIAIPTFNTGSEGSSKRHKSTGSSSFNTESGEASINLNTTVGDNDDDDVQEIRRPQGRDKAKAAGKKRGSKSSASASSSVNEDALARLMVTEMGAQEKEERLAFLEIKRREVECREREIEQQDMRFYLQPYDHLTGDQRKAMDEIRAKIKAKYNLQY